METKYNIDDEVLIKARIRRIAVREDGSIEYAVQGNSAEYMIYKEKDIIERSIKEYGRITQSVICMEECSELIQAVSKQIRGIGSKENLIEEMADVAICLEMLKDIYDIDDTEIGQQIQYKQDRMEQRMDREEICEMCTEYMPDTQCEYETECKMMETLRKIKDLKEQNMVLQEENNRIKAEITGRQS